MPGIFSAVTAAANVIESINTAVKNPNSDNINDALNKLHQSGKGSQLAESKGSITKFLSTYTVEPVIIASKGAKEEEIFERVVGMSTDIFCSFYLQTFEVLTGLNGVSATVAIDLLSTNRGDMFSYIQANANATVKDVNDAINSVSRVGKLSWNSSEKDRPDEDSFNYMKALMSDRKTLSLSINLEDTKVDTKNIDFKDKVTDNKELTNSLYAANFRQLKITIDTEHQPDKGDKIKRTLIIPIQVRAHIIVADINDIANMLTPRAVDKSFTSRFMEWRSGGISLSDLIFCGDLIKEYKANRIKDKQDLLGKLVQKEVSAGSNAGGYNADKFEKHYNMFIITKDDKLVLDRSLRGDLNNEKYKQQFLTQGLGLGLSILDSDYERVEFSLKDIRGTSTTSYKNLKKSKESENNYEKIMQALLMNRPMAF